MSDVRLRCETCAYWDYLEKDDHGYQLGLCRRFPPVHEAYNDPNEFPTTQHEDWCGEWASKEER